ncbi:MAG: NUDIX domain-containing protein [Actinomycetota bacterium]
MPAPRTISAGLAVLRPADSEPELLVVHPGGPFWANKDAHGWSIPKGIVDPDEDAPTAARREFSEETGHPAPDGPLVAIDDIRIGSGKWLRAFVTIGDLDPSEIQSNTIDIEWPPRSGRTITVPEVDAAAWVTLTEAETKLHKGQVPLVARIRAAIAADPTLSATLDTPPG